MKKALRNIINTYKKCKAAESSFIIVYIKYVYYKVFYRKRIIAHQHVTIKGINNITLNKTLNIGVQEVGFTHPSDRTYLNIKGKLIFKDGYSIGRGCRFDVGDKGSITFGSGGYVNADTRFIIMHKLTIGDNCAIAWGCEFLDEDFHDIIYEGKKERSKSIEIGNNVWIGAGAKIYQGTKIADGCIVASNAVVRGEFLEKNTIIGGTPAKVVKTGVQWS